MDALVAVIPEPMGKEWFYPHQFAARYNMELSNAQRILRNMSNQGKTERWEGKLESSRKRGTKYRLKP